MWIKTGITMWIIILKQVLHCKSKSLIRDYRMDLNRDYNVDYSHGIGITIWIIITESGLQRGL